MTTQNLFLQLQRPLSYEEIEFRQQGKPNAKGNIQIVPYINNRAVMNRLDECVKPEHWKCAFEKWGDKGVKCQLSIRIDGEWITKEDCAEETDIEPVKGGISDAMKRASVQWGIGRELYSYPKIYCTGKDAQRGGIPDTAWKQLEDIVIAFHNGELEGKDFIMLK